MESVIAAHDEGIDVRKEIHHHLSPEAKLQNMKNEAKFVINHNETESEHIWNFSASLLFVTR